MGTMVSLSSVTVLTLVLTTGRSRILGVQHGEKKVTSAWQEARTCVVLLASHPTQLVQKKLLQVQLLPQPLPLPLHQVHLETLTTKTLTPPEAACPMKSKSKTSKDLSVLHRAVSSNSAQLTSHLVSLLVLNALFKTLPPTRNTVLLSVILLKMMLNAVLKLHARTSKLELAFAL